MEKMKVLKKKKLINLLKNKNDISNYDEKEILDNSENFLENILNKSLFEKKNYYN